MIESRKSHFECTGLMVYFIYSFALANKVSGFEYEPVDAEKLFRRQTSTQGIGTPASRQGIKQHLELCDQIGWKQHAEIRAEVVRSKGTADKRKFVQPSQIRIQPLVRVFRAGATCCFGVRLVTASAPTVSVETIHDLLGLVQQTEGELTPSRLRIQGTPRLTTLHQLFVECVRGYATARGNKKLTLYWLDDSEGYISLRPHGQEGESQSPWVVTVAEVKGETAEAFCSSWSKHQNPAREKAFRIKKYEPEVAGVLYRSVTGGDLSLEPGYIDARIPGEPLGLHSVNLDARLYVAMSNRSMFCVRRCGEEDRDATSYFIPDLLDLCEMVRARWHMLIIMNRYLDKVLDQLKDEDSTAEQKMRLVISARKWLARLLEDPELYRVAGDALANISLRLKDVFREAALRKLLLEKADLIERIRAGIGELDWLTIRSQYRSSRRE